MISEQIGVAHVGLQHVHALVPPIANRRTKSRFRRLTLSASKSSICSRRLFEEIAVVLVARDRLDRRLLDAAPALYRRKGVR